MRDRVLRTLLTGAGPATAADEASRWDGDARSAIRLIAGSPPAGKTAPLRAGIEIRLKPGWHTYWRYPGDAGVPPQFDFAGSQNVKAVEVLWPAPQRIVGGRLVRRSAIPRGVIFPLRVVPQEARQAGGAASQARLCDVREAVRAGRRPQRTGARPAAAHRRMLRSPPPRRACRSRSRLGEGGDLAIRSVRREHGAAQGRASSSTSRRPRGRGPVCRGADASNGRCRCRRRSKARRPACSASCSNSTARRPATSYEGAALTLTAVAPGRDRGRDPSRLIRPSALICWCPCARPASSRHGRNAYEQAFNL